MKLIKAFLILFLFFLSIKGYSLDNKTPIIEVPTRSFVFTHLEEVVNPFYSLKTDKLIIGTSWSPNELVSEKYPRILRSKSSKNVIFADQVILKENVTIDMGGRELVIIARRVVVSANITLKNQNGKVITIYSSELDMHHLNDQDVKQVIYPKITYYNSGRNTIYKHFELESWDDIIRFSLQTKKISKDGKIKIDKNFEPNLYLVKRLYDLFIYEYKNNRFADALEKAESIKSLVSKYLLEIIDKNDTVALSLLFDRQKKQLEFINKVLRYLDQLYAGLDIDGNKTGLIHIDQVKLLNKCNNKLDTLLAASKKSFFLVNEVLGFDFENCPYADLLKKQAALDVSRLPLDNLMSDFSSKITSLNNIMKDLKEVDEDEQDDKVKNLTVKIQSYKFMQEKLEIETETKNILDNLQVLHRQKKTIYIKNGILRSRLSKNEEVGKLIDIIPIEDAELDYGEYATGQMFSFVGSIVSTVVTGNVGAIFSSMGGMIKENARNRQDAENRRIAAERRRIETQIRKLNLEQVNKEVRAEIRINANGLLDIEVNVSRQLRKLELLYQKYENLNAINKLETDRVNSVNLTKNYSDTLMMALYEVYLESLRRSYRLTFDKVSRIYGEALIGHNELSTCNVLNGSFISEELSKILGKSVVEKLLKENGDLKAVRKYEQCLNDLIRFKENYFAKLNGPFSENNNIYILKSNSGKTSEVISIYNSSLLNNCATEDIYLADGGYMCETIEGDFTLDLINAPQVNFSFYYDKNSNNIGSSDIVRFNKSYDLKMPQITDIEVLYSKSASCTFKSDENGHYVRKKDRGGLVNLNDFKYPDIKFLITLGENEFVTTRKKRVINYSTQISSTFYTPGVEFNGAGTLTVAKILSSEDVDKAFEEESLIRVRKNMNPTNLNYIIGRSPINNWNIKFEYRDCQTLSEDKSLIYKECVREALSCFEDIKIIFQSVYSL